MGSTGKYWREDELNIIKTFYEKSGATYCSKLLENRSRNTCEYIANKLNIVYNKIQRYEENSFREIVENSYSYSDICRKMSLISISSGNIKTIKNILKNIILIYHILKLNIIIYLLKKI